MSARILCTARIFPETAALLAPVGGVAHPAGAAPWPRAELLARLREAEAVMAFMTDRVDAAFLDAAPRLRVLACALKGYDNIDVSACQARGVEVSIVPDLLTSPTAELAVALTLGLARHLRSGDAAVRAGFEGWRPELYGLGLDGAVVTILGLGALGSAIAARLAPFGCMLRGVDSAREAPGVVRLPIGAALREADIVIVALPLNAQTRGLIGAEMLRLLPPHALLVNIGRGSVVREADVLAALEAGRLGGYAADVFEMEDWALEDRPRAIPPGLLMHPATLFTPHLGSATLAARRAIEARAAANILDVLDGRAARDRI
ncbi:hydroxyacid dehydrogenase [Roseococcus sp. SDR]|uniref:NAD(P)-dependent oxidoreductase n=1 Tax=Roseococcus sp. SDR TaxID=2835532 RepID=UPI001BCB8D1F|nr:NAD(P)-dependent oxidoreductase [Roseococcus sp. SDR]MBS7792295.1 hydroxyacid dehydrogenase [Roseococcus sp. SDR]MBV1847609.1 hydroxyacid dehydrogenase [Roseococcus sp. SDR]